MKTNFFVLAIIFIGFFQGCYNKPAVITTEFISETVEEPVEPPPPSFSCSGASTLNELFSKLCKVENLAKSSMIYRFGFFETDNCYAVYLAASPQLSAEIKSNEIKNYSDTAIEYYPLSKNEFKDLKWQAIMSKIKLELKKFVSTENFANSSMGKAKPIMFLFDDGDSIKIK